MFKFVGYELVNGDFVPEGSSNGEAIYYSNFNLRFMSDQLLCVSSGIDLAINKVKTLHLLNFFGIYKGASLPSSTAECNSLENQLANLLKTHLNKDVRLAHAVVKVGKTSEIKLVGFFPLDSSGNNNKES